jgi:hypothetical protein
MTLTPLAETSLLCSSCPHAQEAHDATALRYCAATLVSASTRGCICRGELVDNPTPKHL